MTDDTNKDDIFIDEEETPTEPTDEMEYSEEDFADAIKKLKEKIKVLEKEKQEYLTGWQRTKADYVNSKKEDEARRSDLLKYANEGLIGDLIPALDAFDMAMRNKESWDKVDKGWRDGVEYIYSQILNALSQNGVVQDNPIGVQFDMNLHNPIGTVKPENGEAEGSVAEVLQKGYILNGKPMRPATVKVFE